MTDLRFSRIAATATGLGSNAVDAARFIDRRVLLTGTREALRTENGGEIAFCSLLLLLRMCRNIVVALPAGLEHVRTRLLQAATEYAWDEIPRFEDPPTDLASFDAILSVGGAPIAGRPLTIVTSQGWLARVSSGATPIAQECDCANPIAALAAASLGAGEVFKWLLLLRPDRGRFLDGSIFSLWTYESGINERGPDLPAILDVDVLIAGGGAIGNGVAHLLSRLPLKGRADVVDPQSYGEENWGTCLRLSRANASKPKAGVIAAIVGEKLEVGESHRCTIAELADKPNWQPPPVVLAGLDNVPARYEAQDLWPDVIIDGALGRLLECQVSCTLCGDGNACLRCIFEDAGGESALVVQSRVTGLTAKSLQDLEAPLTEEDIRLARPEQRDWLKPRLGKTKCSIVSEAQQLASTKLNDNFRPSVPFVATMSAAMMVTELVRHYSNTETKLDTRFQFSLLWGPERGEAYPQEASSTCQCVARRHNIEKLRRLRAGG